MRNLFKAIHQGKSDADAAALKAQIAEGTYDLDAREATLVEQKRCLAPFLLGYYGFRQREEEDSSSSAAVASSRQSCYEYNFAFFGLTT